MRWVLLCIPLLVERGARATDRALANAAKNTDSWVKEKTK